MKKFAMILLLAISSFALSSQFTPVSANKMSGKCCQSSDGGRSNRYQLAMRRAVMPHTRAQADGFRICRAAQAQCLQTGVHVGPFSGRQFAGMQRM
jgi:hypothetical protein